MSREYLLPLEKLQKQVSKNPLNTINPKYIKKSWLLFKWVVQLFLIVFIVFSLTFFLFNLIPGEPSLISEAIQSGQPEMVLYLQQLFHVGPNFSLLQKYFFSFKDFFSSTMGYSWMTGEPINNFFWGHFFLSISIGFMALAISFLFGIPMGIWIANRKNFYGLFVNALSFVIAFSLPSFILGLLMMIISVKLGIPSLYFNNTFYIIFLLAVIMSIPLAFGYARYLKNGIRREKAMTFNQFSKMQGKTNNQIFWKENLLPSFYAIINYLPLLVVTNLFGSIALENIFSVPGSGTMIVDSIYYYNQPLLLSTITFYTIFIVISFAIRDIVLAFADPRMRYKNEVL